ncbi:MAG: carboxypeptidase-like regulatory domain-containing protein [Spirochaetaceae bacterium]|nr:carboxypeptidase-like regulatory domain-containing protein [Spirochaetaceae bacterium]
MLATGLLVSPDTAHGRGRSEPAAGLDAAFRDGAASGTAAAGHAPFGGVVTDAGGAPLPDVSVAMCASACWPTTTDESGRFHYPSLPVERYVLDVRGGSVAGRTLTSVVLPVELTAAGRDLPPVQLHDATAIGWEGTEPVEFAGLSLVPSGPVDLGALQRATGAGTGGAASAVIGGARIPPEAWPEYELAAPDARYRPLAMWALHPFGARLGEPLALHAMPPPGFDGDGADLAFFSVDDVTGTAEWLGAALPERGGLRTGPDRGISTLTWVILAARSR